MQVLWAPWRMAYIGGPKPPGCILCTAAQAADARPALVLAQHPAIVLLNKFPYASGHVMVAPRRHTAALTDLPADEYQTLMAVVQRATAIIGAAFHPEGLNIGMNVGAAAGAGVADHV